MVEYLIDKAYLVALADAIRKKSESSSKMTPSAMVSAINNLGDMTYTPQSSPTVINKTGELYTIQDTTFNSLAKAIRNKADIGDKMTPHKMIDVVNGLNSIQAFAVFSADDRSLNFYKRRIVPKAGEQFEGKTATAVYTGIEASKYSSQEPAPWYPMRYYIASINVVDVIKPISTAYWFYSCMGRATFNISNLNTSRVTDMNHMFSYCAPTSLNVSNFDTSNVTNMSCMFEKCETLTAIDVSGFNTSKVTDMSKMFYDCISLTSLNLSNFNTSNVTDMGWMFAACRSLTPLDVSKFNTSNVTDMQCMFYGCSSLTNIVLSNFDTSKVTSMEWMFFGDTSLTTLDISTFDTSSVTNMKEMFYNCYNLKKVTLGKSFAWKGTGGYLPIPSANNISGADGKWYAASDGKGCAPSEIPSNKADTYYAYPPQAFAVYSADDKSLNFYKRFSVPKVGQQFNGRTATNVYADIETTEYNAEDIVCPWESIKPNIKYITAIDKISPRSMCGWFASIEHMHTANIDKIDVSNTMRLDGLFADNYYNSCFRVNIESWNISDACNIDYIFDSLIPSDGNGLTCLILGKGNVKIASKLPYVQYGSGKSAFNIRTNKSETYQVIESGSGGEYIFLSQHLMNDGPHKYAWDADFWK